MNILDKVIDWIARFIARRLASADEVNVRAAEWWAERFRQPEKREAFKAALLRYLPARNWTAYNDYDPQGLLLDAVREVGPCLGACFSGDEYFPEKTGICREDNRLFVKEGYQSHWVEVK